MIYQDQNTVFKNICDIAPSYVREIAPYQSGKPISALAREIGIAENKIAKLASNENPLGFSDKVTKIIMDNIQEISRYPDSDGFDLKQELSRNFSINHDQLVLGNGSNDILELVARAFLSEGRSSVFSEHAFIVYSLATRASGADGICVGAREYGHDLDGMLSAIKSNTTVVFIANPNNPTGTYVAPDVLLSFIESVPKGVVVVLDEAYDEYLPDIDKVPSLEWVGRFPNLIVCRTFSKAYGLAGLRVGYGIAAKEIIDLMNRVRQPFNVGSISQLAAIGALSDTDFLTETAKLNTLGMEYIVGQLSKKNLSFIPSKANFVSFQVPDADKTYHKLLREGVIVRPVGGYGLKNYLRVSIGLEHENTRFIDALSVALKSP